MGVAFAILESWWDVCSSLHSYIVIDWARISTDSMHYLKYMEPVTLIFCSDVPKSIPSSSYRGIHITFSNPSFSFH